MLDKENVKLSWSIPQVKEIEVSETEGKPDLGGDGASHKGYGTPQTS